MKNLKKLSKKELRAEVKRLQFEHLKSQNEFNKENCNLLEDTLNEKKKVSLFTLPEVVKIDDVEKELEKTEVIPERYLKFDKVIGILNEETYKETAKGLKKLFETFVFNSDYDVETSEKPFLERFYNIIEEFEKMSLKYDD